MRVLIVRLRALGDVIHGLPVACALKDQVPGAYIGWLAEERAGEILLDHPAIDQRVVVPSGWTRSPARILRLRRELAAAHFDVVLDLQGVRSSVFAALLAGAPRRLGFVGMVSHELRYLVRDADLLRALSRAIARPLRFEVVTAASEHIVDRYLEILAPLGVAALPVRFGLAEVATDADGVLQLLHDARLADAGFAILNPGGPPSRTWRPERFAALARHLDSMHGLPALVVQGRSGGEREAASEIVAAAGGRTRLLPQLPLAQLGALARRARAFISADTGPLHLAAAVGAPCIGLIGHALAARFAPYGPGNIVVQGNPPLTHGAQGARSGVEAMRAIDVDAVCRACDRLLAAGPARVAR